LEADSWRGVRNSRLLKRTSRALAKITGFSCKMWVMHLGPGLSGVFCSIKMGMGWCPGSVES
jgi:hypothetical protein